LSIPLLQLLHLLRSRVHPENRSRISNCSREASRFGEFEFPIRFHRIAPPTALMMCGRSIKRLPCRTGHFRNRSPRPARRDPARRHPLRCGQATRHRQGRTQTRKPRSRPLSLSARRECQDNFGRRLYGSRSGTCGGAGLETGAAAVMLPSKFVV